MVYAVLTCTRNGVCPERVLFCFFLGCLGPWRIIKGRVCILKGAQGCLAVPLWLVGPHILHSSTSNSQATHSLPTPFTWTVLLGSLRSVQGPGGWKREKSEQDICISPTWSLLTLACLRKLRSFNVCSTLFFSEVCCYVMYNSYSTKNAIFYMQF